jgi:hypothetical protein
MNMKDYQVEPEAHEIGGEEKPKQISIGMAKFDKSGNEEETHEEYNSGKHFVNTNADEEHDNDLIEKDFENFPEIPTKIIVLTIFLFIAGIGFFISGVACYFTNADSVKTITFLLFGVFLAIPGCYYGIFLIQAYRAETPQEREEILDQIPV